MRSRLATRSARVILAVTAAAALSAGLTACNEDDLAAGDSTNPAASTTGGSGGLPEKGTDGDNAKEKGVGQSCGTNDLDFTIAKSDADGYLLITAKAQSGITCHLDGSAPLIFFGSAEKTTPYPDDLMKEPAADSIELSGSTVAWATVIPNTTRGEGLGNYKELDLTLRAEDSNTEHLILPEPVIVDEASVTGWYTSAAASTPDAN